jgi:hypothetical protein
LFLGKDCTTLNSVLKRRNDSVNGRKEKEAVMKDEENISKENEEEEGS